MSHWGISSDTRSANEMGGVSLEWIRLSRQVKCHESSRIVVQWHLLDGGMHHWNFPLTRVMVQRKRVKHRSGRSGHRRSVHREVRHSKWSGGSRSRDCFRCERNRYWLLGNSPRVLVQTRWKRLLRDRLGVMKATRSTISATSGIAFVAARLVNHPGTLRRIRVLDRQITAMQLGKNLISPKFTAYMATRQASMIVAINVDGWRRIRQLRSNQLEKCLFNQSHELRHARRKWFLRKKLGKLFPQKGITAKSPSILPSIKQATHKLLRLNITHDFNFRWTTANALCAINDINDDVAQKIVNKLPYFPSRWWKFTVAIALQTDRSWHWKMWSASSRWKRGMGTVSRHARVPAVPSFQPKHPDTTEFGMSK